MTSWEYANENHDHDGYPTLAPPYRIEGDFRRDGDRPPRRLVSRHPDSIIALMNSPMEARTSE